MLECRFLAQTFICFRHVQTLKKKAYFQQNIELLTWKCDFKNLFQENKRSFGPRSHSCRKVFHRI